MNAASCSSRAKLVVLRMHDTILYETRARDTDSPHGKYVWGGYVDIAVSSTLVASLSKDNLRMLTHTGPPLSLI